MPTEEEPDVRAEAMTSGIKALGLGTLLAVSTFSGMTFVAWKIANYNGITTVSDYLLLHMYT